MASPQTGFFALGTNPHAYLEFDLAAAAHPVEAVARIAALREPRTTIGGVNLVTGFRPELWVAVAPDDAPPGVVGFNEPRIGPTGDVLPATQHDVVIWLKGSGYPASSIPTAAGRHSPADRCLLPHPIGRSACRLRWRGRWGCLTRRSVGARCLDHSGSFGGGTEGREEALRLRIARRDTDHHRRCTDERAGMNEHLVELPLVEVEHDA